MELRRREFLELIALLVACKDKKHEEPAPAPVATPPPGALDAAAYRTFEAAAIRIFPGDDKLPSARDAGVIAFLDRQLAIPPLTKLVPVLTALAHALDAAARARGAAELAVLPAAKQDEVIDAFARGTLGTQLPERDLFRVLHGFVLEGVLSDPNHGGNRDQVGWRAIGFPEPSLRTPGGHHH